MLTSQKFLGMTVMMLVLFFIVQFPQIMKEAGNEYDVNEYAVDPGENASDEWKDTGGVDADRRSKYTLFVGDPHSDIGRMAAQWCTYTKRRLVVRNSISECPEDVEENGEYILLENDYVREQNGDVLRLKQMADRGMVLVFCSLPDPSVIAASEGWKQLLGVREVTAKQVELQGVNLFSGFLLGGQAIYVPRDEEEREARQDLDLTVPWYLTAGSCKTYMVGMLADKSVENEELPALIWCNGAGAGRVFAVNGGYMSDCTALGILDAIAAEVSDYMIYPVINAQTMAVANFPGFASENGEDMGRLYSRDQMAVYRDILWPGLCSAIEKSGAHLTCYLAPQFHYKDNNFPQVDQLVFYLRQMREKGAEAGLTMEYVYADSLEQKLSLDEAFFRSTGSGYRFGAVYLPDGYRGGTDVFETYPVLRHVQTVTRHYTKDRPVVSYEKENITTQSITSVGISHTYSDDIRMKSLETALGYSHIVLDMNRVAWPEKEGDRWELLAEKFSSNINTYWQAFEMFSQTSASESDERIRAFLGADYESRRTGNEIQVSVKSKSGEVWFILRTHGEEIVSMQGGEFEEIEKDAYLIRAQEDTLKIRCEKTDQLYYYLP